MPETASGGRLCGSCGRENPVGAARCADCGTAFAGASLLLTEEQTAENRPVTRYVAQPNGPAVKAGVPLPPQLREEQERRQRAQEERARWQEVQAENRAKEARQVAYEQAVRRAERAQQRAQQRLQELAEAEVALGTEEQTQSPLGQQHEQQAHQRVTVRPVPLVQTVETQEVQATHQGMTHPTVAALSSLLLPGLGQFMNGQGVKALLLLLGFLVATFIFSQSPVGLLVMVGRILAAVDAYRIATRRRAGKPVRDGEWDLG